MTIYELVIHVYFLDRLFITKSLLSYFLHVWKREDCDYKRLYFSNVNISKKQQVLRKIHLDMNLVVTSSNPVETDELLRRFDHEPNSYPGELYNIAIYHLY